jgi:hypothetical protein
VPEHRLRLTPLADTTVRGLRGRPATAWQRLETELKSRGCRVAGYRLLDDDGGWSQFCCKHLYGSWRVISTFGPTAVTVVAVGQHDGTAFYEHLSSELGISGVGRRREQKPGCCGAAGWPTLGQVSKRRS